MAVRRSSKKPPRPARKSRPKKATSRSSTKRRSRVASSRKKPRQSGTSKTKMRQKAASKKKTARKRRASTVRDAAKTRAAAHGHDHVPERELISVREIDHAGHHVRVRTEYTIEIDGNPYQGHVSVDRDGRLLTHAIPYVAFESALDLAKTLIDLYPEDD